MAFDYDWKPERSDFVGLFGLDPGAGKDAARAGVRAAGASLLGLDQPRITDTGAGGGRGGGGGDGLNTATVLALVAVAVAVAVAVRK
jgi:hypothetical protein